MPYQANKAAGGFDSFKAVVPNDLQTIKQQIGKYAAALYVGVGGDVQITSADGNTAVFKNVPSGTILNVRVATLGTAATTASGFVALYRL